MSLNVSPAMVDVAERGELGDAEFLTAVRESLPYAWQVVTTVVADLAAGSGTGAGGTGVDPTGIDGTSRDSGAEYAEYAVPPPDEAARGQLLRALASDAIRGSLERHFGVRLAFQNCHRLRAYRPAAVGGQSHRRFTSVAAQVLNQTPQLRDC